MTSLLAATTSGAIPAPSIEYSQLAPMLVVFGAAIVGVLVEAFVPRELRRSVHLLLAFGSLAAAFIWTCVIAASSTLFAKGSAGHVAAMGAVAVDRPTLFIQGTILVLAFVSVLLIADASHDVPEFAGQAAAPPGSAEEREGLLAGLVHTEIYPLTLFAVGGMLLFPASNDLLTMFVALEVLSLPLYLLCGLARRRRLLSHEASMKYFLLGAFSSAFFLFGVAMLYGFSGSVRLSAIASAAASNTSNSTLLYAGIALVGVGLLFKIGAVPFQGWKPDVYQGAPTPITALMASCTVVSAFGALLRVFYVAFGNLTWDWRPALWVIAILTMVAGAVVAITQTDVKRLLAYSSIAHAGFVLTAVIAVSAAGLSSSLFYLASYGLTTVGAFAVITLVRDPGGEAGHLSRWAGLGRRSPVVASIFALFLIAFAGIPLTSGFTGKFAVFQAAIASGETALVIVGVLSSAIAGFFYVRVIVLMFFSDPVPNGPEVIVPSVFTGTAVGLGVVATVVLGIVPEPVLSLASHAANQLFVS
ncbi:NADH-quinone oxidoreductase subunit NuoN [Trebonia sp.]|uniref:NADH-quinone oxidoreductase subunit NuoN n=1 Tax=Trebonia sp. TaxID=2767075 RepID=UPI0026140B6A|nr:NADH-quinone oxidoreductase subunit NuoN [Trebonia sp.]